MDVDLERPRIFLMFNKYLCQMEQQQKKHEGTKIHRDLLLKGHRKCLCFNIRMFI